MISTLIVEGGIYIKIFNYIYNRKNKERVVLSLTAKEISLLINSLYISQKSISENFKNNFKTYKLAANFESDKNVYNNCVLMFNTAIDLSNIKDKYYLQIKKLKVLDNIDIILKSIPSIYDENNDGTGANMIATIDDYISYFMNNKSFIENCNTIIDKLSTK